MTFRRDRLSRAAIESMRDDYLNTEQTVDQIAAAHDCTRAALHYWVKGGPAQGSRHLPPLPLRRPHVAGTGDRHRVALVKRMWRTADAQVRDIEKRLRTDKQKPNERERDMRLFATLARTLRELTAAERGDAAPAKQLAKQDDDTAPRNIDELRRSIAERMEAVVARRKN